MSATLIQLSAISPGCRRPRQAELTAQGSAGISGAGNTALAQDRHHAVDERHKGTPIMSTAAERQEREHGSQIIAALERTWADPARHPEVPGVVIVTRGGQQPGGNPQERPAARPPLTRTAGDRPAERPMPGLFIASELLAAGGRAVLEEMLHKGSRALAVLPGPKR
jgi:hypothetical protein